MALARYVWWACSTAGRLALHRSKRSGCLLVPVWWGARLGEVVLLYELCDLTDFSEHVVHVQLLSTWRFVSVRGVFSDVSRGG